MSRNWLSGLALMAGILLHGTLAPAAPPAYGDVAAIFQARCVVCHTGNGLMGPAPEGYRLTSYAAALSAADRVRIVPGHPATSELVRRITGQSRPRMPFDGPPFLDEQEISRIAAWVAQGARNPEGQPASYPVGQRLRLQGRLVDLWQLDGGVRLHLSPATRRDKVRGEGDYVEVRGRLLEDGAVAVERIRRR